MFSGSYSWSSTARASICARSRTFFGYRTFFTSSFIAESRPPAPSTSSALSRYSGRGIRSPRSIL